MFLLFMAALLALLAGVGGHFLCQTGVFDIKDGYNKWLQKRLTWREFAIGAMICCVVIIPLTVVMGNKWALSNNLTYNEFWSGYETQAVRIDTGCSRDSGCAYTYQCDPYEVTEIVSVPNADGKGSHTETRTHTEYHHCPYSTTEWDFTVKTTLGDYHIERTFPDSPQEWRGGHGFPGNVRQGTPPFWQAAANRLAAGDPGPVTKKMTYDNYILASQSSILKKYSTEVDRYKAELPAPASTRDVRDFYYADKAYFTDGVQDQAGWSDAVSRFNAAFGSDKQGDLHLVVVGPDFKGDPDSYTNALNAYWTGTTFGKDALSKNALVVVIHTDGKTVTWARAFTGMPLGNEGLLLDIQNTLKDKPFTPESVLGKPVGTIKDGKFSTVAVGEGVLAKDVWGVNKFERVSMTGKSGGGSGFDYLSDEIQPSTAQKAVILTASFFLSLLVWIGMIVYGTTPSTNKERT